VPKISTPSIISASSVTQAVLHVNQVEPAPLVRVVSERMTKGSALTVKASMAYLSLETTVKPATEAAKLAATLISASPVPEDSGRMNKGTALPAPKISTLSVISASSATQAALHVNPVEPAPLVPVDSEKIKKGFALTAKASMAYSWLETTVKPATQAAKLAETLISASPVPEDSGRINKGTALPAPKISTPSVMSASSVTQAALHAKPDEPAPLVPLE